MSAAVIGEWLPVDIVREGIRDQICPWCGRGRFQVLARHVQSAHGITAIALRDMAEISRQVSICDPAHSKKCADRAVPPVNDGKATASRIARQRREGLTVVEKEQLRNQGWVNKYRTDPEFRRRAMAVLAAPEVIAKAKVTRTATTSARRVAFIEAGPHDERNYRWGCRCEECLADHARHYRIYRKTGSFPPVRKGIRVR